MSSWPNSSEIHLNLSNFFSNYVIKINQQLKHAKFFAFLIRNRDFHGFKVSKFLIFFFFLILGHYVGSRPIKLRKSTWRQRSFEVVKRKEKEKTQLLQMFNK